MQYTLALLPPHAAGFVSKLQMSESVATQKFTVTTAGAPGINIPSHAPPGYAHSEEADYNNTLGYLENGNQR